ncbi:minor capsid protein [Microbacterium sp. BG28]|uniref:phage tail terminator protein n=1 Tax=Microbacterium sp. BG28 TaxID=3097356 RepID=UPI002A5A2FF0|nr:minor capsid protein [Microbacterium sp. BG28]MDY0830736.1 minor capsid protein [Microbacterium sp. BG28]
MDDRNLTIDLCERLGQLDGWAWSPDYDPDVYTNEVVAVFYGRIRPSPDKAVGVRVYGGSDDVDTDSKTRRVQLRSRGASGNADDADVIADAAHDLFKSLLREGVISEVTRTSFSPLGADDSQREERTDNYLVVFDNSEAVTNPEESTP